ncbi:RICIN domain-containing protein [Streptomyces sp. HUAS TT20]|uniref:RICIN domain-containing protein n=1 Tax=Streptomyces sp. HUAS TT20 TaxID=3447509 RepID=UPI0021D8FE8D|nr:RICIN domain-containing protein [Streptomyces sp. HUAS 15-9]UXY30829.1 RICIN domain-containing protein [Streptomyces sp. HUAS 15-9]
MKKSAPGSCWSLDGSKRSGAVVKLRGCARKGSAAAVTQTFTLKWVNPRDPKAQRLYEIRNKRSGLCLKAVGPLSGGKVAQVKCAGHDTAKRWWLAGGTFHNVAAGRVILAKGDARGRRW